MRCGSEYGAEAGFCPHDGSKLIPKDAGRDPLVGTLLLDQFEVGEPIGSGGMGTVYKAIQTSVGREVAIKVLRPELVESDDAVWRFQREARLATALDHPNLVRVLLSGQLPDGRIYIVMELLKGRTLADVLEEQPVLPLDRALKIMMKLCAGIDAVHAEGIVHRDIKPENIFLVKRGNDSDFVKVVDFGIARTLDGSLTATTQSGRVLGTASYISPEGAAGEPTDPRSDVYSIAVLTYQLLCGELPFEGAFPGKLLTQHVHEAAPDLRTKGCGDRVPESVANVVMQSLSKNADTRHQSVAEFVEALAEGATNAGVLQDGRALLLGTMWGDDLAAAGSSFAGLMEDESVRGNQSASSNPPAPNPAADYIRSSIPPEDEAVLSVAPDPFKSHEALGSERKKGRWPLLWLLGLGLALSAIAIVAVSVSRRSSSVAADIETQVAEQVAVAAANYELAQSNAMAALKRGDFIGPQGKNVLHFTQSMLDGNPTDSRAMGIRGQAVSALVERAEQAVERGDTKGAADLYQAILKLQSDHPNATAALAGLATPEQVEPVQVPEPVIEKKPDVTRVVEKKPTPPPKPTAQETKPAQKPLPVEQPKPVVEPTPEPKPDPKPPAAEFPDDEGIDWTMPKKDDEGEIPPDPDAPPPPPKSPDSEDLVFDIPPPPEPDPK